MTTGASFRTPEVEVTEAMRAAMVELGGYTHPLFATPDAVSLPAGSPLPGQGVLLLMGGLVERSGRLDDAVALLGFTGVAFRRPAVPGTRITVEVTELGDDDSAGRRVRQMRWVAVDADGRALVEATASMLVAAREG